MFSSLVVVFSALISASAANLSSEFAHHAVLDPAELMKLYWTVDWDKETVSFAVEAATTGWVGFGFSSGNGKMAGSDVVIGWVKDSKGYLTDRFADEESLPPLDKENNYVLTGFEESDKKTVLRFNRKFDTCDPRDRKIEQGTTKVVFAYHTEDPGSDDDIKYHTFRGSRSILLLNNMDEKQVNETGWKDFVMNNKNITIPKKRTTYWCSLIRAPEIKHKHHITKFEPYIQKGNEGLVHHLVIYECHNRGQFNDSVHYGPGFDCQDYANMPFAECYFYSVVGVWAVGAQAFYYPPNVGYVIGSADSPNSYMLEIHYDNPKGIEGRKDSSGLRFFYTPNLRKYDAGVLTVGESSLPYMVIPPKQESWITYGFCPKECSQEMLNSTTLPGKGIKVFAAFLHTHLQGSAIWTKHVRDGVELPEIARDDNYDFNFQDIQVLSKEVHVKPGDDLINYCKYQTMDKNKIVVGGLATSQEMCIDMLFYYPKMPKEVACNSIQYKPVHDFIDKYFPHLKPQVTSLHYNPLVAINITWTEEMVSDLRRGYDEAKTFIPTCKHNWLKGPPYNTIPIPKITKPLPPPESKCQEEIEETNSSMKAAPLTFVLSLSGFMAMFL
ncbi:DBH-like monooxygenase protein 1 homolog isoform X1 [Oculina patagonica]